MSDRLFQHSDVPNNKFRGYTTYLNVEDTFGLSSFWNSADGVRELIQNTWDGAVKATRYGGKKGLDPSEILVIRTQKRRGKGSSDGILFDGYSKLHVRAKQNFKVDKRGHLFQIHFSAKTETLKLINFDVALSRRILVFGNTSKTEQPHQIGGHGEGLKLGNHEPPILSSVSLMFNLICQESTR